jgi:NTE family protein
MDDRAESVTSSRGDQLSAAASQHPYAAGTGLESLVKRCPRWPDRPPLQLPQGRTAFGLTFSGGGFRATLAALGVIRFMADVGCLGDVRFVSSVSGGSIANGVLACRWTELKAAGFRPEVVDELVIEPVIEAVTRSSLKRELILNLWRAIGAETRTDLLAAALDRRFFHGRTLESLDHGCRFTINAANLTTGVRFAFDPEYLGDYVVGLAETAGTGIRVASAVAASAAVPGAFAPMRLSGIPFACAERGDPLLLDGGAYDNTGLEALDSDTHAALFLVIMNAGGVFSTGDWGGLPFIRNLLRSNALLYRQSTGVRARWMIERFKAAELARERGDAVPGWGRRGVWMALATEVPGDRAAAWGRRHPEHRVWDGRDLAFVPTVFDQLDVPLCRLLVYRGWWLVGATMAQYHPELVDLPAEAPPL